MNPQSLLAPLDQLNGTLLINKHAGVTSFGIIEDLQRILAETYGVKRRDLPKVGHGGTLDPFATGLLNVCVGRAVKLARYFLGSAKAYEGTFLLGQTTMSGDPTNEVTERSDVRPTSIEVLQTVATQMTLQPYLQTPPMHSAKKKDGKPLYELARAGIEVEREPKLCTLSDFEILNYDGTRAEFRVTCTSGTYIRTLAQDFARLLGTVGMLERLHRTGTGQFRIASGMTLEQIREATRQGKSWDELDCWVPFDRLLDSYNRASATQEEALALMQGRQNVLFSILKRTQSSSSRHPESDRDDYVAIFEQHRLIAVAKQENGIWGLERVFTAENS